MFHLTIHELGEGDHLLVGSLPARLLPDAEAFESIWNMHPDRFHQVRILGRTVSTPRWQQACGKDYRYTGTTNTALPIPRSLDPFLEAARDAIDPRLNGMLLNWYDGKLKHHIGRHRDSRVDLVLGAPIVTISIGEERVLRLRPWKGKGFRDIKVANGTVVVMP